MLGRRKCPMKKIKKIIMHNKYKMILMKMNIMTKIYNPVKSMKIMKMKVRVLSMNIMTMVLGMKAIQKTAKDMVKENSITRLVVCTMDNGKTEKLMVLGHFIMPVEILPITDNGRMRCLMEEE